MEAGDLTVLVIRASGLILGKMVRDDSTVSTIRNVKQFIPTTLVAAPAASEEVDEARWIPIPDLAADENATEIAVATAEGARRFPAVALGSWVLWGLTHRILAQLLPIVGFRLADGRGRAQ